MTPCAVTVPVKATEGEFMKWRQAVIAVASAASCALAAGVAMASPAGSLTATASTMAAVTRPAAADILVGHWGSAQQVPGLAALNVGGNARVEAMDCASPGNCLAAGTYQDASHRGQVFATFEVNGVWKNATPIPDLPALNAGGQADVSAVSCGEAGDCSMGGSYTDARGDNIPWVADSVINSWIQAQALVTPDLTTIDASTGQHLGDVTALSCASAGNCAAMLSMPSLAQGSTPLQAPFRVTEVDGIWGSPESVPIVSSTAAQLPAEMTSVSCSRSPISFCIAGGSYTDGNGNEHAISMDGFVDSSDGRGFVWGAAGELPGITGLPGYNTASPFAKVDAVNCLANGDCAASGFYLDVHGHDQVFTGWAPDGGQWTNQAVNGAADLNTGGRMFADDMSCGVRGECAVVGSFTDSSSQEQAWVNSETGGLWNNAQQILGVNDNSFAGAGTVSCAGAGFCYAGGLYTDTAGHDQAFVAGDIGGSWGGAQQIAGNINAGGNAGVTGISCTAAGNCAGRRLLHRRRRAPVGLGGRRVDGDHHRPVGVGRHDHRGERAVREDHGRGQPAQRRHPDRDGLRSGGRNQRVHHHPRGRDRQLLSDR